MSAGMEGESFFLLHSLFFFLRQSICITVLASLGGGNVNVAMVTLAKIYSELRACAPAVYVCVRVFSLL